MGQSILGCIIGIVLFYIICFIYDKTENWVICILCVLASFAVAFGHDEYRIAGIGMIVGFVAPFVVYYIKSKTMQNIETPVSKPPKVNLYVNHCWNCYNDIDSRRDKLCTKCGKHYICSKCGKCYCDKNKGE